MASAMAVERLRDAADSDIEKRVSDGGEVAEGERLRFAGGAFVAENRDLDMAESPGKQPGEEVGLESESVGIRMPTHHVVAEVDGKTVVVPDRITAQPIHKDRERP